MGGWTLHDSEMRPAACRLVGLRVAASDPALRAASGYLEATTAAIADRLEAAGLASALATRLASGVLAFVTDPGEQGLVNAPASRVNALVGTMLSEGACRSEEHTSELQSLMRTSYAVFCLEKKNTTAS